MDCLEVQRVVSEKLDRSPVDVQQLEMAKEHCRTCTDCAAFVRALRAVVEAPLPEPTAGLHDRIMGAIGAEAKSTSVGVTAVSAQEPAEQDETPDTAGSRARLKAAFRNPRNERAIIAWTAAAAVLFVAVVIGSIEGIQTMFAPPDSESIIMQYSSPEERAGSELGAAPEADTFNDTAATDSSDSVTSAQSAGAYISVVGTVYRAAGPAVGIDPLALQPFGTTVTALDSQNPPSVRDVLRLDDPARVYLTDGAGGYLGFDRVTRTYEGRVFALQSGDLQSYGQWPSLPATIPRPVKPDGSPSYLPLGADAIGVTVFGPGGSASQGVLVAPGTSAGDPAGGNPDWTWWKPVQ